MVERGERKRTAAWRSPSSQIGLISGKAAPSYHRAKSRTRPEEWAIRARLKEETILLACKLRETKRVTAASARINVIERVPMRIKVIKSVPRCDS